MTPSKGLEWKPLKPYLLLLKVGKEICNTAIPVIKETICLVSLVLSNTDYAQQPIYIAFMYHVFTYVVKFEGFGFVT